MTAECRRVLSAVSAYLDGDLDRTACESIEAHCRGCAGCADVIAGLQATVGLCRQAASAPLPEAVRQRARASVQRLLDRDSIAPRGSTD
jgi:anti-sigma factor RsiW